MLGSPEERKEAHERAREDGILEPEIIGVHSHSLEDDTDTDTMPCSRCFTMPSGDQCCPEDPNAALHAEGGAERNPLQQEEEEGEDVEEKKIEGIPTEKCDLSRDDINSKLRFIFHLDGFKEAGGEYLVASVFFLFYYF